MCAYFLIARSHTAAHTFITVTAIRALTCMNPLQTPLPTPTPHPLISWAAEQRGELGQVRSTLMAAHQSAVLRRDAAGQETLLNLLLRSYLSESLYDQVGGGTMDLGLGMAQGPWV